MLKFRAAILLVTALFLLGCDGSQPTGPPGPEGPPAISLADLLAAPDVLVIDGVEVKVSVFLTRSYCGPNDPPDGGPLFLGAFLDAPDESILPGTGRLGYAWVIHGTSVWATGLELYPPPDGGASLPRALIAAGGPNWGPALQVDVVIGARDANGELRLAKSRGVTIERNEAGCHVGS